MEKKIYGKLVSTLVATLLLFACGKKGPLIPRNQLVPPPPVVNKIIMGKSSGTIYLKLPSFKIQQYRIEPVAVEISSPGKKILYDVATLNRQLGFYTIPITRATRFFRLRSLSRFGKGKFTNWFYLPPHPNLKPPEITSLTLIENGIKFKWKAEGKNEGILIYLGSDPEHLKLVSLTPRKENPVYLISLPLHKHYFIAVRTFITCEKKFLCVSPLSATREFYTRDVIPPPPPASLSAMRKGNRVYLFWEAVSTDDLLYYRIYRKNKLIDQWSFIGNSTTNRFVDRGCKNGEKCYYTITAVDKDGNESTNSNIVVVGGE